MSDAKRLVFVDPALDDERARELAEALGCEVGLAAPAALDPDALCEEADGIVVAWDLGGHCGLDLVETLRARGCELPLVLASSEPSRARVVAALRAGSRGFARQPYDPAELPERLGWNTAQPAEGEESSGADSPAGDDADAEAAGD